MMKFISWAIIKQLTEYKSVLPKRGIEAHFPARLQPYIFYAYTIIKLPVYVHLLYTICQNVYNQGLMTTIVVQVCTDSTHMVRDQKSITRVIHIFHNFCLIL